MSMLHPLEMLAVEAMKAAGLDPCRHGHVAWTHLGGKNASCDEPGLDCSCSVPVYGCEVCGDSDYGDNQEADDERAACRVSRGLEAEDICG